MRFLFRAAFWLLVMSAVIPTRGGHSAVDGLTFGDSLTHSLTAAGEAVSSWCSGEPAQCLGLARAGTGAVAAVAATATPAPIITTKTAARTSVPLPAARPTALAGS